MIGTQRTLGVGPPASALLYVIASPVGPYYPTGFKAVSLEATDYAVRAWPGGVGDKKLGANYAPCIVPQMQAASRGFHQNLWLFGEEEYVTEVGTMNLFAAIKNKETGQPELLTAPLDGTILEGVTRDSILGLARERLVPKGWKVLEQKFTMKDIADAADEGRMMEIFGAGTAAIVSPVRKISWKGRLVDCGLEDHVEAGPIAQQMKDWMEAIQYGDEDHPWRYAVRAALECAIANALQLQGGIGRGPIERASACREARPAGGIESEIRGRHDHVDLRTWAAFFDSFAFWQTIHKRMFLVGLKLTQAPSRVCRKSAASASWVALKPASIVGQHQGVPDMTLRLPNVDGQNVDSSKPATRELSTTAHTLDNTTSTSTRPAGAGSPPPPNCLQHTPIHALKSPAMLVRWAAGPTAARDLPQLARFLHQTLAARNASTLPAARALTRAYRAVLGARRSYATTTAATKPTATVKKAVKARAATKPAAKKTTATRANKTKPATKAAKKPAKKATSAKAKPKAKKKAAPKKPAPKKRVKKVATLEEQEKAKIRALRQVALREPSSWRAVSAINAFVIERTKGQEGFGSTGLVNAVKAFKDLTPAEREVCRPIHI
jgi:branched-subunit amino acid aminotransferase/4-amino-4-deoxychorismate lyase